MEENKLTDAEKQQLNINQQEAKCDNNCNCSTKKPELTEEQKAQVEKQKKFFEQLRRGAYFLKFIHNDIQKMKQQQMNRNQRRRFEKELKKGVFSKELIDVYLQKIEETLEYIESKVNPQPKQEVDAEQYFKELKEKEVKGEIK